MRRNKELALKEAKQYNTRQEMFKQGNALYQYLHKRKLLDEACSHMVSGRRKYTDEEIIEDAKKYNTRYEWQKNSSLYYAAKNLGKDFLESCCVHMEVKNKKWTKSEILTESKKYKVKKDFEILSPIAYAAARRLGYYDEATMHMESIRKNWTDGELKIIAKKYKYKIDFIRKDRAAYSVAYSRNILDKICEHMETKKGTIDLEKKAILYYICIDDIFYKIGITNLSVSDRFDNEKTSRIRIIKEWYYDTAKEAIAIEKQILKKYSKQKAKQRILHRGNTEIFKEDVLQLDN